jgi:hypothetical protein
LELDALIAVLITREKMLSGNGLPRRLSK